jgi:hypothetical protein
MIRNQDKFDERLSKATLNFKTFADELLASRRNGLIDDDLGKLLTTLSDGVGAQLEALQLLSGAEEEPGGDSA